MKNDILTNQERITTTFDRENIDIKRFAKQQMEFYRDVKQHIILKLTSLRLERILRISYIVLNLRAIRPWIAVECLRSLSFFEI